MAKKEFILQGFTARTHVDAIKELFHVPDIQHVLISVAFVSKNGVDQIQSELSKNASNVTVFAGIRNEITSHQALSALYSTGGMVYVVDPGTRSIIFHPKIYLVRGKSKARLIIGSANLTLGGLHNNIEAGMLIDFDLSDLSDKSTVDSIEYQLNQLPQSYPENIGLLSGNVDVDRLLYDGRIIDEALARPSRPTNSLGTTKTDNVPRITLSRAPIRGSKTPQPPSLIKTSSSSQITTSTTASSVQPIPVPATGISQPHTTLAAPLELVWESSPLKARSLQLGTGNTATNSTGSANLGKGNFSHIDQVTYFRNDIFSALNWNLSSNGKVETVDHDFDLVIRGIMVGTFSLTLRHSLTRVAKATKDANIPTGLSWNNAKPYVAKSALLGATMRIWRSASNSTHFRIEID